MEILSSGFLSALLAIVIIDLVLAGDNAIVIALAARNLPDHLRTKAVVWGTVGAIIVRSAMTLGVVWLLNIPGLLLAGGALLLWIAYKLLINSDNGEGEGHKVGSATNFWAAIKTIVIADMVMGLDNVLAVAGAAHGNFLLVVLGLLISIPIVVGGSQLLLKYVQKYPSIVYVGAGVLVWTGVKMMTGEPLIKDYTAMAGHYIVLVYAVAMGGVLGAGLWANQGQARSRVAAHVVDLAAVPATPVRAAPNNLNGENIMRKILIPVDGTASALQAVRHVVNQFNHLRHGVAFHLLGKGRPQFLLVKGRAGALFHYGGQRLAALEYASHRPAAIPNGSSNLIQFHPEAHDFHLKINPLLEKHMAIAPLGPVPGVIPPQHLAANGHITECRAGPLGVLPIAIGQLRAGDDNLTLVRMGAADQMHADARNCLANCDRGTDGLVRPAALQPQFGHCNRCLGWPVGILDTRLAADGLQRMDLLGQQRLATKIEQPHRGEVGGAGLVGLHHQADDARHRIPYRDFFAHDHPGGHQPVALA